MGRSQETFNKKEIRRRDRKKKRRGWPGKKTRKQAAWMI